MNDDNKCVIQSAPGHTCTRPSHAVAAEPLSALNQTKLCLLFEFFKVPCPPNIGTKPVLRSRGVVWIHCSILQVTAAA